MGCLIFFACSIIGVQPGDAPAKDAAVLESRAKAAVSLEWKRWYGDKAGRWYEGQSIALSGKDDVVVAVISFDLVLRPPVKHLSVATYSASGEVISDITIPKPKRDSNGQPVRSTLPENVFIGVLASGDILLAGNIVADRPWVMVVNREGRVLHSQAITEARRPIRVTNMIRAGNDEFVVMGDERMNSVAFKIDASGKVIWEVAHDRGASDFFVGGLVTRGGATILVENSGESDFLFMGPSSVIVGRYDASGRRETEIQIPGRNGSIVEFSGGTYALVYDRNMGDGQDVWVMGLDRNLREIWANSLSDLGFAFPARRSDAACAAPANG